MPISGEESMMACERKLSLVECFPVVPAPDNDGPMADFYKGWKLLGYQLTDTLNHSYEHGELSHWSPCVAENCDWSIMIGPGKSRHCQT